MFCLGIPGHTQQLKACKICPTICGSLHSWNVAQTPNLRISVLIFYSGVHGKVASSKRYNILYNLLV